MNCRFKSKNIFAAHGEAPQSKSERSSLFPTELITDSLGEPILRLTYYPKSENKMNVEVQIKQEEDPEQNNGSTSEAAGPVALAEADGSIRNAAQNVEPEEHTSPELLSQQKEAPAERNVEDDQVVDEESSTRPEHEHEEHAQETADPPEHTHEVQEMHHEIRPGAGEQDVDEEVKEAHEIEPGDTESQQAETQEIHEAEAHEQLQHESNVMMQQHQIAETEEEQEGQQESEAQPGAETHETHESGNVQIAPVEQEYQQEAEEQQGQELPHEDPERIQGETQVQEVEQMQEPEQLQEADPAEETVQAHEQMQPHEQYQAQPIHESENVDAEAHHQVVQHQQEGNDAPQQEHVVQVQEQVDRQATDMATDQLPQEQAVQHVQPQVHPAMVPVSAGEPKVEYETTQPVAGVIAQQNVQVQVESIKGEPRRSSGEGGRRRGPERYHASGRQLRTLIEAFEKDPTPAVQTLNDLSTTIGMPMHNLVLWFKNRRARHKKTHPNQPSKVGRRSYVKSGIYSRSKKRQHQQQGVAAAPVVVSAALPGAIGGVHSPAGVMTPGHGIVSTSMMIHETVDGQSVPDLTPEQHDEGNNIILHNTPGKRRHDDQGIVEGNVVKRARYVGIKELIGDDNPCRAWDPNECDQRCVYFYEKQSVGCSEEQLSAAKLVSHEFFVSELQSGLTMVSAMQPLEVSVEILDNIMDRLPADAPKLSSGSRVMMREFLAQMRSGDAASMEFSVQEEGQPVTQAGSSGAEEDSTAVVTTSDLNVTVSIASAAQETTEIQ